MVIRLTLEEVEERADCTSLPSRPCSQQAVTRRSAHPYAVRKVFISRLAWLPAAVLQHVRLLPSARKRYDRPDAKRFFVPWVSGVIKIFSAQGHWSWPQERGCLQVDGAPPAGA